MVSSTFNQNFIRVSFLIIYFWFGILKVLDLSGATPLVADLLHYFFPSFHEDIFLFYFGLFEISIGLSFIFPQITRWSIFITSVHLLACTLPLLILPLHTWQQGWVLTQTGQYIVKNIFVVSALINLNYFHRQQN